MQLELRFRDLHSVRVPVRTYDAGLDDVRAILMDVCKSLEQCGEFLISGFGQHRWPVDMGTDLGVFLEQLPDLLKAVAAHEAGELDLYEQGVERFMRFAPSSDSYTISCVSSTSWQPDPSIETIDREALLTMLMNARSGFLGALHEVAPALERHPWMQSWIETSNPPEIAK